MAPKLLSNIKVCAVCIVLSALLNIQSFCIFILQLPQHGSLLGRSGTLLPPYARSDSTTSENPHSLFNEDPVDEDSGALGNRGQVAGHGLRCKAGLSCFNMKADSASVSVTNYTHFIKSASNQTPQFSVRHPLSLVVSQRSFAAVFYS